MPPETVIIRKIYLVGAIVIGLCWLGLVFTGDWFVSGILEGRFLPYLGQLVRFHMTNNPDHADPAFYASLLTRAGARAFLLWIVLGGIIIWIQRCRPRLLTEFVSAPDHAVNLAVTRVVVFLVIFFAVDPETIREFSSRPADLRQAPNLMGWWLTIFPIEPGTSTAAAWILKVTCLLAAAGVFTRFSAPVAAVLAIYVLGIPNYFGKVNHSYHAIVWFAMVLAASPSGDALSVDAWRKRTPTPAPSRRYGFPLRVIWLLFAAAYFFPGAWKFILSGWEWAFSENLKFKMYSAWLNADYVPAWRIDRYPILYQSMAALSMLWEIAFPLLILFRRTRVPALLIGLGFHWSIFEFMRIGPFAMPWGYVAFVDWRGLIGTLRAAANRNIGRVGADNDLLPTRGNRDAPPIGANEQSPLHVTKWVGYATLILATVFGALLINSWPFSVYPTHAGIRGPTHQTLEMVRVDPAGLEYPVDLTTVSPTSLQGIDFKAFGGGNIEEYCRALANAWLSRRDQRPTAVLRFYRTVRYLSPDDHHVPPLERELLFQFAPEQ